MVPEEEYAVPGFLASSVRAGIKKGTKRDLALFLSEYPTVSSVVFTRNLVKAAPVIWAEESGSLNRLKGVLVNSGNANACTGTKGIKAVENISRSLASLLSIPDHSLLLSSTGVIGVTLDEKKVIKSLGRLKDNLSRRGFLGAARAMMTTDSGEKILKKTFAIGGRDVTLLGVAKGAGMIGPSMATMLAYFFTDCKIRWSDLNTIFKRCVNRSFNAIIVDGDMSTNDTAAIFANGVASKLPVSRKDLIIFEDNLLSIMKGLSMKIVEDGEGASRVVKIDVLGADSVRSAERVARTVATSLLVKTAIFGADLNWGRVVAAAGRAGVAFDPALLKMYINGNRVFGPGMVPWNKGMAIAKNSVKKRYYEISLHLGAGGASYSVLTSDLTLDYVTLNSEYTS